MDGNQTLPNGYCPQLEKSDELIPELVSRYLQLIGILHCEVELGHIQIFTEVAVISQYSESPLLVHLEGLYHMFEYIRKREMCRLVLYLFQSKVDESAFASGTIYWKGFYGNIEEDLPTGMPDPLVKSAHTKCFVDANHAGNVFTWSSYTGALIYETNAPII